MSSLSRCRSPASDLKRRPRLRKWFGKPSGDPIGDRLSIDKHIGPEFAAPPRQIIGIVGDVRDRGLNRNPEAMMYVPQAQVPDGMTAIDVRVLPITWAIRARSEPHALSAA